MEMYSAAEVSKQSWMTRERSIKTLLLTCLTVFGNGFSLQAAADETHRHISSRLSVIAQYQADLNQDGMKDKILVLEGKRSGPANNDGEQRRTLVILLGTKSGFEKVVETDKVVYCETCGGASGDPYVGITIKPPYFTVEHSGGSAWRWQQFITFKYSKEFKGFVLHKNGHQYFHATSPDEVETKIQTSKDFGIVRIQDFDVYKN